jgi:hypothetical protein
LKSTRSAKQPLRISLESSSESWLWDCRTEISHFGLNITANIAVHPDITFSRRARFLPLSPKLPICSLKWMKTVRGPADYSRTAPRCTSGVQKYPPIPLSAERLFGFSYYRRKHEKQHQSESFPPSLCQEDVSGFFFTARRVPASIGAVRAVCWPIVASTVEFREKSSKFGSSSN